MVENKPASQPGTIEVGAPPDWRRYKRWLAMGGLSLASLLGGMGGLAEAQTAKTTPDRIAQTAPQTTMPEIGVATTCDLGCNGTGDGNYPIDQELADIKKSGIQVVRQLVNLDQVVNIDGIAKNYSPSNCTVANNPNYNLVQLDQIDSELNSIGVKLMLDLDSPRLASIDPKVLKCISYAIAKHYDGRTATGPPAVTQIEGGNEENDDPEHYDGPPEDFAVTIEAISHGVHAAVRSDEVLVGGLRADGVGMPMANFTYRLSVADPNPTFNTLAIHVYPQSWTYDTPTKTLAGRVTKLGGDLTDAISMPNVSEARLIVNTAWPNRAYTPGAQISSKTKDQPLMIYITESGWRATLVDSNGVSLQTQANYDGQEIESLQNNTLGITGVLIFHWLSEAPGPDGTGGFQTGSVYESGSAPNQAVSRVTPMTKMFARETAVSRQANTGGR